MDTAGDEFPAEREEPPTIFPNDPRSPRGHAAHRLCKITRCGSTSPGTKNGIKGETAKLGYPPSAPFRRTFESQGKLCACGAGAAVIYSRVLIDQPAAAASRPSIDETLNFCSSRNKAWQHWLMSGGGGSDNDHLGRSSKIEATGKVSRTVTAAVLKSMG